MKIAELLQELDAVHHIPAIAWIDNWALSAGAMLAYSCRYIAVSPQGLMGAAEPVHANAEGKMESAPEKIVSALRAEFASLAKTYGRNPLLAEAMVDKDIFLVRRKGEIVQLQQESEIKSTDAVITARGKLLTLDAEQLIGDQIADWLLPQAGTSTLHAEKWQAESDKLIAQAKAEERRAMADAMEHENSAKVRDMEAKLVDAEAQIPMAIAEAFRKGNLGVLDYYRLKNIQADTAMRKSLSHEDEDTK